MTYTPDPERYDGRMPYHRTGRTGLLLPALSLGLWHNFGDDTTFERQEQILQAAFDAGITHFDLANNYGPERGSAELNFGRHLQTTFRGLRDELVIATKAGWDMWPGPYGKPSGSRKYLVSSLDQSLQRMGLDYVDIYYHHRPDAETPLEETMTALDAIVRSGKALYVGISSYTPERTREAAAILRELGTPLAIHQPSYSMLNRWTETDGLLDALEDEGAGCIAFSPLHQGLLTNRYLGGVPEGSRATKGVFLSEDRLTPELMASVRGLHELAEGRGQTLAQMALAWAMRDPRMTSLVIGASSAKQLNDSVGELQQRDFTAEELAAIDRLCEASSEDIHKRGRGDVNDVRN